MPKAVRFDHYGDESVLQVVEVPMPEPGPGEVVVRVVAAGTNPGEIPIRQGAFHERWPSTFPEGQGSDFAGVVSAVGGGVADVAVGDAVIGLSDGRNAQAEYAVVPADRVAPKPDDLDWDVAATLYVAGTTALILVSTAEPKAGETVAVSGAAGGVGVLTAQLALRAGARVLAIASEANHEALRRWGAEPVAYGDGLEERLRDAAPDGVDAFLDAFGGGYADLAVRLGVPKERIVTIADFAAGQRLGVQVRGHSQLPDQPRAVADLARRIAAGELEVPIKARFPLEQVQEAYREVARRSGLGKVVLEVTEP
jgi:NADPH:quinone reductase-like Zn-dependent oxidoreductase